MNISTPLSTNNEEKEKNINFDTKETFEINSSEKNYLLKISLNEKLMFFEIEEKNSFSKGEYNIFLNFEELGKIDKFFLQFYTLKEILDSLKKIISQKKLSIIKEESKIKLRVVNPVNDREFFINIPLKEKDLKSEVNSLISYVTSLNEKIQVLENKLNEIYIYKNDLEEMRKEKELKKYEINKSQILNKNEIELFLSWLKSKPKEIKLLLDSKIDGDLTQTFYNKCSGKYPTVVFVKTTKGRRFGGYSSIPWKNLNGGFERDEENFIFSLDKQKKYIIQKPEDAIETHSVYFAFGGGNDFYVYNQCTSCTNNYNNNSGTYNTTEKNELNGGEQNYTVSSYEVYQIGY